MNLTYFNTKSLQYAARKLFADLGITLKGFEGGLSAAQVFGADDARLDDCYLVGMIDDDVLHPSIFQAEWNVENLRTINDKYPGLLVLAAEWTAEKRPTRTELADLTRKANRNFPHTPVTVVFRYADCLALANAERSDYKHKWREGEKIGKVSLLKDINTAAPHSGHLRILQDLSVKGKGIDSFDKLYNEHWRKVLDTKELNNRFYRELSNWFAWATQHAQFPDDVEKDADKRNATSLIRLLTRLIFTWFLKEKGLVNDKLFDEAYLQQILKGFNDETATHYYNAILQNLFFATLNQKMGGRSFAQSGSFPIKNDFDVKNKYRFPDFFKLEEPEILELFAAIPFLNGGLFDCLDEDKNYIDGFSRNAKKRAILPDFLFFQAEKAIDLNGFYGTKGKGYKAQGLINLLNRYKFTIEENTPIEEEIALDPELLGKVFENLLASYNEETKTTARKQTGSFYTPREIVEYMTDESLIAHLAPDDAPLQTQLRRLLTYETTAHTFSESETKALVTAIYATKILDPACGSGAFPMGVLQKMVYLLNCLDPENSIWVERQRTIARNDSGQAFKNDNPQEREERLREISEIFEQNRSDYAKKLYLIRNCIFGIDIQPIAIQISKLRFFISLIIEQDTQPTIENRGIRALPNLETKFVAANTLIGLEKPKQGMLRNLKIEEKEKQLAEVRSNYFNARTRQAKKAYQTRDHALRTEIVDLLKGDGWLTASAQKIADFDPYNPNRAAEWFDPEWMFGVTDGFDVVIGNPPYVGISKVADKNLLQKQGFKTFESTGDLYSLFYEKGNQLLKNGGVLSFITSNKWMRAGYGKSLRNYFIEQTNPITLIDFGQALVFESAIVHSNILLFKKEAYNKQTFGATFETNFSGKSIDFTSFFEQNKVLLNNLNSDIWNIASDSKLEIKLKAEKVGTPLKKWNLEFYRGLLTGYNDAFIIDKQTKNSLIREDPKSIEIIKPILRGRDVRKYHCNFGNLWLINSHNGVKSKNISRIDVEKDYPAIYKYLLQFKEKAESRTDKGEHWTNLRNCAYLDKLEKPKLVFSEIVSEAQFHFDTEMYYPEATVFFISGENLKYLIALLNSKPVTYIFKTFYAGGELVGKFRYKKAFLQNLPIPYITPAEQAPFISLVERILRDKTAGVDTTGLEAEIDALVYELYDLTEAEIAVVEGR